MSNILICAFPNPGHVTPMLSVGLHLAGLGHTVTFHTGEIFHRQVETAGLRFAGMTGRANIDYRNPGNSAEKEKLPGRDRILNYLKYWFIEPIPDQHRRLQQVLEETPMDLILTSSMYLGCFPMLLGPRENRPPVIGCGVTPLILRSIDCGLTTHDATPEGRKRNQEEHFLLEKAFQPIADQLNQTLAECAAPSISGFWADSIYTLPDLFLQFTGDEFEFPRSDMPSKVQFVGPVLPPKSADFKEPAWWSELDGSKQVVLVTQGTLANFDLQELVQPALTALADENALVIAATGRADTGDLIAPTNAKVKLSFLSFGSCQKWMCWLPMADMVQCNRRSVLVCRLWLPVTQKKRPLPLLAWVGQARALIWRPGAPPRSRFERRCIPFWPVRNIGNTRRDCRRICLDMTHWPKLPEASIP